ncbi:Ionotropic receptor 224 [Frankliniella occidentalis]|nr:Ionotropic receptor 224 [Frankliniella occidentalis]
MQVLCGPFGVLCVFGVLGLHGTRATGIAPAVDPGSSPGSKCVADLLSALLSRSRSGIILMGAASHTGALLRELPPEVPRSLLFEPGLVGDRLEYAFNTKNDIFVVVRDGVVGANVLSFEFPLHIPPMARVVVWAHGLQVGAELTLLRDKQLMYCLPQQTALVTTTDLDTRLFTFPDATHCHLNDRLVRAVEVNRCPSVGQRWQKGELVVRKVCTEWQTVDGNDDSLEILVAAGRREWTDKTFDIWLTQVQRVPGHHVPVRYIHEDDEDHERIRDAFLNCRMAALMMGHTMRAFVSSELSYDAIDKYRLVVVVPVGRGPQPGLLRAVTSEFSAALWIATALSVPCMAAAMAAAAWVRGRHPSAMAAFLEALAPLLGQPPPGSTTHRPLSAVWLLMCVVVAAAYQGLLLSELTAPPPEIDNLEQLEDSGLRVYAASALFHDMSWVLPATLASRATFVHHKGYPDVLRETADGRNSAVIIHSDRYTRDLLWEWLKYPSPKLHTFWLPATQARAKRLYSKGSPLLRHARMVLRRMEAAGLLLKDSEYEGTNQCVVGDQPILPLALGELQPAFVLLAVGHCLGGLAFVTEVLYYRAYGRQEVVARGV